MSVPPHSWFSQPTCKEIDEGNKIWIASLCPQISSGISPYAFTPKPNS